MLCFFLKLPHSSDVSHLHFYFLDESGFTNESWCSVFISKGERCLMCFYSTCFSGSVLPTLYIKTSSFSVVCLSWELRFKSLTNVFVWQTVETSRLSADVTKLCGHSLPWQFSMCFNGTWQNLLTGQGYPGLRALRPTSPQKEKIKGRTSHGTQSINQSPATDEISFIQKVWSNVCVVSKNQYFVPDVCTAEPCVHFLTAECVCCVFLLFFFRCPGSFTNLIKCKDVGLLNGTPRFFLHGSFFVWRKKRSLFCTQIWCKKEKKKSSSKKLVFHYPLTQRNLSFAIIVICSTFVNTMFLIHVHRHECQYNCKRF